MDNFIKGKLKSGRVYFEFFPLHKNDMVINLGCGQGAQAVIYEGQFKKMVGVDINCEKLKNDSVKVKNYTTICANVEKIPLKEEFDKAIAVDIIEHVQSPLEFCHEIHRLLKKDNEVLITFPAMYDYYRDFISWVGRVFFGRKKKKVGGWNPDAHNQRMPLKRWINMVESCGFELKKSRATTLFPPLHLFGIPRFWFSNNLIHKIDSFFCRLPIIKNFGQGLVCIFKK